MHSCNFLKKFSKTFKFLLQVINFLMSQSKIIIHKSEDLKNFIIKDTFFILKFNYERINYIENFAFIFLSIWQRSIQF